MRLPTIDSLMPASLSSMDIGAWFLRLSFGRQARMHLYGQLSSFTSEGLPPYRALERSNEVARKRLTPREGAAGAGDRLVNALVPGRRALRGRTRILDSVLARMAQGRGLGEALRGWVPTEESEMIRSGERADRLQSTLKEVEHLLRVKVQLADTIRTALISVGLRFGVLFALMFYILETVLKEARHLIPEHVFQTLTLAPAYFALGEAVVAGIIPMMLLGSAAVVAIAVSMPRWEPFGLRQKLDIMVPPWSVYARIQSATLLTSASAMMESGSQFRESLLGMERYGDPWIQTHCRRILARLRQGMPDAEALQTGMLPWELEDRLAVYAMLDDFKQVMKAISREALLMVLRTVERISTVLNYTAMICLGLFVIFTVFSVGEMGLAAQAAMNKAMPTN